MLPLQKTRQQLHLETLTNAIRSHPLIPCILSIRLTHPLTQTLDIPYTSICLVTVL